MIAPKWDTSCELLNLNVVPQGTLEDFRAASTSGPIRFHEWAAGHWTLLLGIPVAFTPACTRELALFSQFMPEFKRRGIRLLGVTPEKVPVLREWYLTVQAVYGVDVAFPSIEDTIGMVPGAPSIFDRELRCERISRSAILLDDKFRVRLHRNDPFETPRDPQAFLDAFDTMQTQGLEHGSE